MIRVFYGLKKLWRIDQTFLVLILGCDSVAVNFEWYLFFAFLMLEFKLHWGNWIVSSLLVFLSLIRYNLYRTFFFLNKFSILLLNNGNCFLRNEIWNHVVNNIIKNGHFAIDISLSNTSSQLDPHMALWISWHLLRTYDLGFGPKCHH